MRPQIAESHSFKLRAADKRLYLGLFIAALLFLASYLLENTMLAAVAGLASFAAKAVFLVNLIIYIVTELSSTDLDSWK